jgi:DNA-binding protein HU-beta
MMNKTELVKAIAENANLKVSETEKMVNAFLDSVAACLKKKNKVTLVGFGTFAVAHRKQKMGINPKTGQKISIKAKNVPVFRAGKALKDRVK